MFTFPVTLYARGTSPSVSYTDNPATQVAVQSAYTFTDAAIGTADTTRYVVAIPFLTGTGTAFDFTSVTFGGSGGTQHLSTTATSGGVNPKVRGGIFGLAIPTGTTSTIVVTMGGAGYAACGLVVYAIYDLVSNTPAHTDGQGAGNNNSTLTATLDVPGNGALLGFGFSQGSNNVQTISGVTEDSSIANGVTRVNWGHRLSTTAETGATVTHAGTSSASMARIVLAASWS